MDNLIESIKAGQARSENCGAKMGEIGTGFHQFGEEILSVTTEPGSSFTALLGLPANQAVELLVHSPETDKMASDKLAINEPHTPYYRYPPPPIFPSDTALIDRASKFSVFAATGNSPESNSTLSNSGSKSLLVKQEPIDSDFNHNSSPAVSNQKTTKRKEREKKVKETSRKGKRSANDTSEDGAEKLPYVHVRARRGQATDSHSLAERARREKINARMKLLQELVPGCNKISGTAMVLDEIINHVQSLQRQVEVRSRKSLHLMYESSKPFRLRLPRSPYKTGASKGETLGRSFATNLHAVIRKRSTDNLKYPRSNFASFRKHNHTLNFVGFLSMRLAAVNPRIDFNLDSLFAAERSGSHVESNLPDLVVPPIWAEGQTSGNRNQYQHLWHFEGFHQPVWGRIEDNSSFVTPENSLLTYDSSANSASLHPNQLKMEL